MMILICTSLAFSLLLSSSRLYAQDSVPDDAEASASAPIQWRHGGAKGLPEGVAADDWARIRAALASSPLAVQEVDGVLQVRHQEGSWTTAFDRGGSTTMPDSGAWTWGLGLASWGFRGGSCEVDKAQSVTAEGGTVSMVWSDALTEWWTNDAHGLEHGLTVHERPAGLDGGAGTSSPLRFTFDVEGDLLAEIEPGRRSARFVAADGSRVLNYSGLVAFDANGNDLDAWMETVDGQLTLCVEEEGALYPLTVDPFVAGAYLKASNADQFDAFGWSVAASGDTIVVGSLQESSNGTGANSGAQADNSIPGSGAVYVFVRSGGTWAQEAYLKASNPGMNDQFGLSVAISGDTIVVGAPLEDSNGTGVNSGAQSDDSAKDAGAAYIFTRTGTTWSQEAYLKASNAEREDLFGSSVAVDGDLVVVGAPREDSNGSGANSGAGANNDAILSGAAYIFTRSGTTWAQDAYVKAPLPGFFAEFGGAVATSEGNVAIGAEYAANAGAAYVFVQGASGWVTQGFLTASNSSIEDRFGASIAIFGDTVVVGASGEDSAGTGVNGTTTFSGAPNSGAAYVFSRSGATWSEEAIFKASNSEAGDLFGWSVAIFGDVILVSSFLEASSGTGVNGGGQADNSAQYAGAAYAFERAGTSWVQRAYLKASNTDPEDLFGAAVAVSEDALVVSATNESSNGTGVNSGAAADNSLSASGAAYVFDMVPAVPLGMNYCTALPNSSGAVAVISAAGSDLVASNDVRLTAEGLPVGTFGFFLTSPSTGFTMNPNGSQGNLCLGSSIGRYVGPGQIQNSGAAGSISLAIDLHQHPTPSGLVAVQPGQTWHFTTWFRDSVSGQATSNFSDGLSIDFL